MKKIYEFYVFLLRISKSILFLLSLIVLINGFQIVPVEANVLKDDQTKDQSLLGVKSQEIKVSGKLTDEDGGELPGVNVVEKGTTNGSITDIDGNYIITLSSESSTLIFSYVGYTTQEVIVGKRTTIDVTLATDVTSLDEIVVIGYGTSKKSDLTGSIASAPLESFREAPNTNILQSLNGSVPGVTIGQTTLAGQEPSVRVRGRNTINGSRNPLIVLDGIIYRGRLGDLNPKDIKSIDILKDASSKAIYGAQAANGVLLVTTNKGHKNKKPSISYSTFYSAQSPAKELKPLSREGYLRAARDVDWENSYLAPDYQQDNPGFDERAQITWFPPLLDGYDDGTDYNWYDEVTDPGYIIDHQLSVSGGSERTSFFISGGYTNQKGWMLNDKYNRKTARINFDTKVTNWLTVGVNSFGSFTDFSGQSPDLSQLIVMSPLATPRDENGELIANPNGDLILNPYLQAQADDKDLKNNISGILYGILTIPKIEGLSYRLNFSTNYRWSSHFNSNPYGAGLTGSAYKKNSSTMDMMLDNIVTYGRRFGNDDHGVKATFLYGMNTIDFEGTTASGTGYSNIDLSYNALELGNIQRISSQAWEESYLYQMARINYDFRRKYLLSATIRRDGFSGFSENNKTALFPSVGLGWVMSSESFLSNNEAVNFLKLRVSFGVNGNLTGRYSSLARVTTPASSLYVFGDGGSTSIGQSMASMANPNLGWETTSSINGGIDFELFNSRLTGSFDFYNSTTTDLLWDIALPQMTGFTSVRGNVGEIANSGIEIQLNGKIIQSNGFNWDIGFNFDRNINEIKELIGLDEDGDGQEDDLVASGLFIGESIGAIYNYDIDGLWQIADQNDGSIQNGWEPGMYRIVDQDGDGEFTPEGDRKILGRSEPAYSFGIQNTLSYKGFIFRFFIRGIQGGKDGYMSYNNAWVNLTPGVAQNQNWFEDIDYWSPINSGATHMRPGTSVPISAVRYMQRNFVRLQDISLAYDFNSELVQKAKIQNLRLYISSKNLLTISDWEGWDPETGRGLSRNDSALPLMKGFSAGLEITF